jgi:hypothetical protein
VGRALAGVFLALPGFVSIADAGATFAVLAATGLANIEAAKRVVLRLLRLLLAFPGVQGFRSAQGAESEARGDQTAQNIAARRGGA